MTDPNEVSSPTAIAVLTHVIRSIVDDPEAVSVAETEGRNRLRLEVKVGPGDLGRVIGRRGRTAQSIRTLVRCCCQRWTRSRRRLRRLISAHGVSVIAHNVPDGL